MLDDQPTAPTSEELDGLVALVVSEQASPERATAYLGSDADGVRAELDGLPQPWAETARVRRGGGRIAAAVVVEWDDELGRSWLHGPWSVRDGSAWLDDAEAVLRAGLVQLPPGITRHEISADVSHEGMAALAARLGWGPTQVNHALVADAATVRAWDLSDPGHRLRPAVDGDTEVISPLHDSEFPTTYASAEQLLEGAAAGERILLVAEDPGGAVAGYVSGQVQPDGEGYLDFVAVHPDHRGTGIGAVLVTTVVRALLERSSRGRVSLTVEDSRAPARALYERLGFRPDGSIRGYRSWAESG